MACGAVFPLRDLCHFSKTRPLRRVWLYSLDRSNVAEPEQFQIRQMQSADGVRRVAERIAPLVTIQMSVGKFSDPNAIQNYQYEFALC